MCIALLAQVGLEAVGFFTPIVSKMKHPSSPPILHDSHSFSWKILSEFFISDSLSNSERECLYMSKNQMIWAKRSIGMKNKRGEDVKDPEELVQTIITDLKTYNYNFAGGEESVSGDKVVVNYKVKPHNMPCTKFRISDGWTWFSKFMLSMSLPVVNLACSIFLLACVRCRRRKGFNFIVSKIIHIISKN